MAEEGKIDPSSPFYLGAGDQPGNLITHVVLKGDNYLAWSRAITLSLRSRRKFVFVDGTITKPTEKKKLLDWETVNSMLVSWLLRSMDPKIAASMPYFDEAKRLWDYLEQRFCISNGPRLQQLRAKITDCKQTKGMSVEDYYTTLMALFDELTRLKPPHGCECGLCTCNVAAKYATDREEEILHQFYIGIDDDLYAAVRTNLLSQQPPPDLNRAYQAFLQEEESRGIAKGKVDKAAMSDAHAFAVTAARGRGIPDRRDKSKLYYSHCRKSGHDNAGCFVLHGYPEWWYDLKKGKAPAAGSKAPAAATAGSKSSAPAAASSTAPARANAVHAAAPLAASGDGENVSLADLKPEDIRVLLHMVNRHQQDRLLGPTIGEPDWSR